ncbi:MAG: hypothetical protein AAF558_01480 [Verrucomicrobiota bacterium]
MDSISRPIELVVATVCQSGRRDNLATVIETSKLIDSIAPNSTPGINIEYIKVYILNTIRVVKVNGDDDSIRTTGATYVICC